jgi:hypothetical protein
MTEKTYNVGDTLNADEVRSGMMTRRMRDDGGEFFYLRRGESGWCVGAVDAERSDVAFEKMPDDDVAWSWSRVRYQGLTIVAMGLTGDESPEELRHLAGM